MLFEISNLRCLAKKSCQCIICFTVISPTCFKIHSFEIMKTLNNPMNVTPTTSGKAYIVDDVTIYSL